jgi:hypothetical protein
MNDKGLYILTEEANRFLNDFAQALQAEESESQIFYVWGIGGTGKSKLLSHLEFEYREQVNFINHSFAAPIRIESPLDLMKVLYHQLYNPVITAYEDRPAKTDPFTTKLNEYWQVRAEVEDTASGKGLDEQQRGLLKQTANFVGTASAIAIPGLAPLSGLAGKGVEMLADIAGRTFSKEHLQVGLRNHSATKDRPDLQELMLDPIGVLTETFIDGLCQLNENNRLAVVLDTYEKIPINIDEWLQFFFYAMSKRGSPTEKGGE